MLFRVNKPFQEDPLSRSLPVLVFAALCCASGFAQTREETMEFLTTEIKSYETRAYHIPEVKFSASGDTFTIRRGLVAKRLRTLIIPLKHVDIFTVRVRQPNGVDSYNLVARTRGRDQPITVNNAAFTGTENIIGRIENRRQAQALERAFARLIELTTGRKALFTTP